MRIATISKNKGRVDIVCIHLSMETYRWGLENAMSLSSISDSSESEGAEYTTGLVMRTGTLSSGHAVVSTTGMRTCDALLPAAGYYGLLHHDW